MGSRKKDVSKKKNGGNKKTAKCGKSHVQKVKATPSMNPAPNALKPGQKRRRQGRNGRKSLEAMLERAAAEGVPMRFAPPKKKLPPGFSAPIPEWVKTKEKQGLATSSKTEVKQDMPTSSSSQSLKQHAHPAGHQYGPYPNSNAAAYMSSKQGQARIDAIRWRLIHANTPEKDRSFWQKKGTQPLTERGRNRMSREQLDMYENGLCPQTSTDAGTGGNQASLHDLVSTNVNYSSANTTGHEVGDDPMQGVEDLSDRDTEEFHECDSGMAGTSLGEESSVRAFINKQIFFCK